mgnify:CR=1 FL=1
MTETIQVGILSAVSALLGSLIAQWYESKKRKSEEKRWYADYFLGRKTDALSNLYAALVDCHFAMNFYGNCPPTTLQEFKEKVQPKEETYLRAKVMASIYLADDADKIMASALGAFRQASMAIWLSLPKGECPVDKSSYDSAVMKFDWSNFSNAYEAAVSCLKTELNPKVLDNFKP